MSYSPFIDSDEEVEIAPSSTRRLKNLQTLRARSTSVTDTVRRELQERWDLEDIYEDQVTPPEYYKRACEIVAGVEVGEKNDVDFQVVGEMIADFLPGGSGGQMSPQDILSALSDT